MMPLWMYPILYFVIGLTLWLGASLLKYQKDYDFLAILANEGKRPREGVKPGTTFGWYVMGWPLILFVVTVIAAIFLCVGIVYLLWEYVFSGPDKLARWLFTPKPEPEPLPQPDEDDGLEIHEVATLRSGPERRVEIDGKMYKLDENWNLAQMNG